MISVVSHDLDTFRELAREYEESLPHDLRHPDLALSPDAAFVALSDGVPCGCAALSLHDGSSGRLRHMYVRPAYRNRGVARALFSAFVNAARERGCARVILDTDRERLEPAYTLYQSLGFTECAPYGPVDYANPTYMELALR